MSEINELFDACFFGKEVISFGFMKINGASQENSSLGLAVIFVMPNGNKDILIFSDNFVESFAIEMNIAFANLPDGNIKAQVDLMLNAKNGPIDIDAAPQHPISVLLNNIPTPPAQLNASDKRLVVSFVHINPYTDLIKLDVSFLDKHTDRYSIPITSAAFLCTGLQKYLTSIR